MDEEHGRQVVWTVQQRRPTVRNGTAIGLVVLLVVILGAMALQLAQAR